MPHIDPLQLIASLLVHALFFVVPGIVLSFIAYYLLSLPARRQEQARLFVHVLELCAREGKPVEPALVAIANTHDNSPGLRFHLTAAHVEEGDRLPVALEKSRLLPRAVNAMLAAGEKVGDVKKVLPACRMQLRDAQSGVSAAMNHFFVLVLGMAPIALLLMWMIMIVILPKMREVAIGVGGGTEPGFAIVFLTVCLRVGVWVQTLFIGSLVIAAIFYLIGPESPAWLRNLALPVVDWIAWRVPWKRRRMQRNFAAILAALLDSGMPEPEALRQAAAATANDIFRRRAARAIQRLSAGETLTQAVTELDDAGEFRWRLTNAAHAKAGFTHALRGWFESLDARAFQQEQAAAHLLTTGLVVVNGLVVGGICAGMFGWLTSLIETGVLW